MRRESYPSAGGGEIRWYLWEPEGPAKGIVQMVHGIAEHAGRYAAFGEYLAGNGWLAAAEDHMGHGETVSESCPRGCVRGGWDAMTADVHGLTLLLKERRPGLPVFLLGHSMGSFLARTFLYTYPAEGLRGAVLSGTAWQPEPVLAAGKLLTRREIKKQGADEPSPKLQQLMFGAYGKQFPGETSPDAWICSDPAVVARYGEDPLCGFVPSAGLVLAMLEGLGRNQRKENLAKMPDLPVFFIAGGRDPVGSCGRGVKQSCEAFRRAGLRDVSLKLYAGDRHEVLNEKDKARVWADVLAWLEEKRKEG
jgi:alpha-beta hydrolase superfamily lysophospholipase